MDKDELHYRLTQPRAFEAGARAAIREITKLALKITFRITLIIAVALAVLAVVS